MSENITTEQEAPKTITIDDVAYDIGSLTEKGVQLITSLKHIEKVINDKTLEMNIVNLAKAKILQDLSVEKENFTKAA